MEMNFEYEIGGFDDDDDDNGPLSIENKMRLKLASHVRKNAVPPTKDIVLSLNGRMNVNK